VAKDQTGAMLANQENSPAFWYNRELSSVMSQDHPRTRPMTAARLAEMDLDKSMAFYKARLVDAGDFTFVFVGNLDVAAMRPLAERYLATLPATGRNETWRDTGITPPTGVVTREVRKGLEPQSQTTIVFTGAFAYNQTERISIRAMADILQTRLRETLREELGGTYSVSVGASYDKIPTEEYSVTIRFGSAPDRMNGLVDRVFEEIAKFKADGPTPQQVADEREQLVRAFETSMRQNGNVLAQLAFKYQNDEPPAGILDPPQYYEKLTAGMVQAAARLYLNTDRYVRVTLLPEGDGPVFHSSGR
jgi:zinc protease